VTEGQAPKPALFIKEGGVLALSGPGLLGLLQAVLGRGVPFRFRARGFSMYPFIRDGDVISVASPDRRTPGVGQVVAFIHPDTGKLVVHRVLRRRSAAWLLRGDNVRESDGLVPLDRIVGRVISVERGGRPVRFGLGPERIPIALLNLGGWLPTLTETMWRLRGFALALFRRERR